jgi:hypothetical protein
VKDVISGAIALTFGMIAAGMAWLLEVGHPSRPSPGFFPFIASAGIAILGAALLLHGIRNRRRHRLDAGGFWSWQAIACLLALAAYAHFMAALGFTLSTLILMAVLFGLAGLSPWYKAALAGAGTAGAATLIFDVLLKMTLPAGPFGF